MVRFYSSFLWNISGNWKSEIDWKQQLKIYRIMVVVSFLFGFFFGIVLCIEVAKMIAENEAETEDK